MAAAPAHLFRLAGHFFAAAWRSVCHHADSWLPRRHWTWATSAHEIAEDIAREINGDSGEVSYHGVFVAAGEAPTEGELAEARRRLALAAAAMVRFTGVVPSLSRTMALVAQPLGAVLACTCTRVTVMALSGVHVEPV